MFGGGKGSSNTPDKAPPSDKQPKSRRYSAMASPTNAAPTNAAPTMKAGAPPPQQMMQSASGWWGETAEHNNAMKSAPTRPHILRVGGAGGVASNKCAPPRHPLDDSFSNSLSNDNANDDDGNDDEDCGGGGLRGGGARGGVDSAGCIRYVKPLNPFSSLCRSCGMSKTHH